MNRRHILAGIATLPVIRSRIAEAAAPATRQTGGGQHNSGHLETPTVSLTPSSPIVTQSDGQIIENLDIDAQSAAGVTVRHRQVTVRNCRIQHTRWPGVHAKYAAELVLQNLAIDHVGAPASGVGPNADSNNVTIENCPGTVITRVKASRGASNIYLLNSAGSKLTQLELHDARGPEPRGQNIQFDKSPDSTVEDFSAENGPTSWTEDNISIFLSDRCILRRGLVRYNNSPSGDGVMLEGSSDCIVEDVDAEQQGNGAFAAVPTETASSGGCVFLRCRTRHSYNEQRDGRDAPSSKGLAIYTRISAGARKHTITGCQYFALRNNRNLIWDVQAVNAGWSFIRRAYVPRSPIRLEFGW